MLKAKLLGATAGAEAALAIEDVFSTYLYTGNSSTQTITNGIDLAGEGGLVWTKRRNDTLSHQLFDTLRGVNVQLATDVTNGNTTVTNRLNSFNVDGFTLGGGASGPNVNGNTYASWTFRQAPRFFDVVTYTGDDVAGRTITHDLGVEPGCIIVKATSAADNWVVYHRSNTAAPATDYLTLNSTAATADSNTRWNDTLPTSTVFSLGTDSSVNTTGRTYVAYLFAHDPLGPSGDGSDGLIACGSYTGNGSTTGPVINLGWEPQWVLWKSATAAESWGIFDNMRGWPVGTGDKWLSPAASIAEQNVNYTNPTATGFQVTSTNGEVNTNGATYIYIAIRRGPMREPTVGTEVFAVDNGDGSSVPAWTSGFPVDMAIERSTAADDGRVASRLTSGTYLITNSTAAEAANSARVFDYMNGWLNIARSTSNYSWMFRRAPGFFDVVAYTGNGVQGTNVSHNLGVAPDLMIVKKRDTAVFDTSNWGVYVSGITQLSVFGSDPDNYGSRPAVLTLNATSVPSFSSSGYWDHTHPTSTYFRLGDTYHVNRSGSTYIAYLFASLPGISKVGSYTGNGSSQTINCAFTTGARFVLIKRTDSTGDWYVWDTARGIVSGNDPHLSLNTTAAEVTTDDTIDPDNSGFIVNQVAATNVNVNAATYIYFAVS